MYSGYLIIFDGAVSWNFCNDITRNVVIFDVDNSSSSHADSYNNNFVVLGEGPTYGITGGFSSQEKKIIINFSKARAKFCLTLHYNGDSSVNEKEIYKFKANDKNFNFPAQFCLRSISNGFAATKTREV